MGEKANGVIYCGVFNCERTDCKHHIVGGTDFGQPQKFNNLDGTVYCAKANDKNDKDVKTND